ncbi:MAG: hypothetical protein JO342_03575, partial [Solirubrobacterales bacterium]|nr:hypothetical protein [Solirubrobacterales bacterium]
MTALTASETADPRHRSADARPPPLALREEACWAAATMAVALVAAIWSLRLWRGDLHVPFSYENDGQFYAVLVKEVIHGWYFTNPRLGAPFGSELLDFPQGGDQLSFLIIKALGLVWSDWALVMNLFFLLTFPLVALSAYAVMRRLGASPPASTLCASLFALLPYHFWQGEFHLVLSAYYAVPLGCYLVLATYRGDPLFARRAYPSEPLFARRAKTRTRVSARRANGRRGILAWTSRRSLVTLAMCCVIGSGNLYYAAFTIVLLAFAAVVVAVARRSLGALVSGTVAAAAILGMLAINISPTLVYRVNHGTDSQAFRRTPAQSEEGSLRPGDLVLPLTHHRIAAFARLRESYSGPWRAPEFATSEGESATLGLLATAGLAWLALTLLAAVFGIGARWDPGGRFRPIAVAAGSAVMFATVGGTAIAYLITPEIRQWTRLSIFVGFFALLAVALLLDQAGAHLRRRYAGRISFGLLLLAIGALALFDQTSSEFIPPYRELALHYHSDQAFVASIERELPRGSAVLQLPYMPWPEPGFVNRMTSFDPARGYLHSSALRWSYGAMRGRPADWQAQLAGQPPAVLAAAAVAGGFDGIYIDRLGYSSSDARRLEHALTGLLNERPMVSGDGRLSFFDIRSYASRLRAALGPSRMSALKIATLYPLRLDAG